MISKISWEDLGIKWNDYIPLPLLLGVNEDPLLKKLDEYIDECIEKAGKHRGIDLETCVISRIWKNDDLMFWEKIFMTARSNLRLYRRVMLECAERGWGV